MLKSINAVGALALNRYGILVVRHQGLLCGQARHFACHLRLQFSSCDQSCTAGVFLSVHGVLVMYYLAWRCSRHDLT